MKKITFCFVLVLFATLVSAQNFVVTGRVVETDGSPIVGANVYMKNTTQGAVTDVNGEFRIEDVARGVHIFAASYIGFNGEEQLVDVQKDIVLNFTLKAGVLLEGLVVTAQKREQSIKEIPTALTSISADFIEKSGNSEIDQLAAYIPGLEVQVQSPNNPGFVVRGITSDDGASNVEPRVSIFQDGVSISKSRGSVIEVYDMQRVEVLKGPQGTLFGRGAQIGALHFIQNKPKNYYDAGLTLGFGNYNYKHIEVFGNAPIVKDKLLARISGIYKKRDGFIKNLSGGNLNGKDTKAVRASLKWIASPQTDFTLIANYQKDTPPGTAFKSGTYAPKGGDTSPYTFADLERGNELGLNRKVWGLTLLGEHRFSDKLSLSSITAYRKFDSDEAFDADGTAAPVLFFHDDSKGKQFSQEFRLNFEIGERFEGFAGANYFMEEGSQNVPLITDERSFLAILSPLAAPALNKQLEPLNQLYQAMQPGYPKVALNPVPLTLNGESVLPATPGKLLSAPLIPYNYIPTPYQPQVATLYGLMNLPLSVAHTEYYKNYGDNSAYEFFGDGTYKLTERLKLTAGVRLSIEKITSSYEAGGDNKAHLGFVRNAGSNLLFMPTPKLTKEESFNSWVGRLALNYAINKDWEIYGTISKGRRPNVVQFISSPKNDGTATSSYASQTLNDEIVKSYELGVKALTLGSRLYFDFAAFYYDYTDFQTSTVDPQSLQIIYKDAGDATAYGAETSLKWNLSKVFSIFGNYAFVNAEFAKKDSEGNKQALAGNTFRLTPKHSFAVGANVSLPLGENLNLFFRPVYHYKSKIYFEETNLEVESQEGYGIFDARAGLQLPQNNLSFTFFMNNILNEKYLIDAGNTGRNFGIPTFIAGTPRMWGIEMNISL